MNFTGKAFADLKYKLPRRINGLWQKPKIPARELHRIRKETLRLGEEWPWEKPMVMFRRPNVIVKGKQRHLNMPKRY